MNQSQIRWSIPPALRSASICWNVAICPDERRPRVVLQFPPSANGIPVESYEFTSCSSPVCEFVRPSRTIRKSPHSYLQVIFTSVAAILCKIKAISSIPSIMGLVQQSTFSIVNFEGTIPTRESQAIRQRRPSSGDRSTSSLTPEVSRFSRDCTGEQSRDGLRCRGPSEYPSTFARIAVSAHVGAGFDRPRQVSR